MAIKKGDKIKVEYEGKLESGEVFDSSKKEESSQPLEFEVGAGQVIKGFDEAVEGMDKGQSKEFSVTPDKAYGEKQEGLEKEVPRDMLPKDKEPKEGMVLMVQTPQGQQFPAKIASVAKEKITLDLNHPLAGKELFFNIKVLDIEPSSPEKKS